MRSVQEGWLALNLLQSIQFPDRPSGVLAHGGPRVALIHGFLGRAFMRDHLLRYLRLNAASDITMYGHLHAASAIADELETAPAIAIIGYSLGGFQAVRVARELARRNVPVRLLATIGSGGLGRSVPWQWSSGHRRIPANVGRCLNYAAGGDFMGTDRDPERNMAVAGNAAQPAENLVFARREKISHMDLIRCYPDARVHPLVRDNILLRLKRELGALCLTPSA